MKKSIVRKVTELLEKDLSVRAIAEKAGTSTFTVQKVKKSIADVQNTGSTTRIDTKNLPAEVIAEALKGRKKMQMGTSKMGNRRSKAS